MLESAYSNSSIIFWYHLLASCLLAAQTSSSDFAVCPGNSPAWTMFKVPFFIRSFQWHRRAKLSRFQTKPALSLTLSFFALPGLDGVDEALWDVFAGALDGLDAVVFAPCADAGVEGRAVGPGGPVPGAKRFKPGAGRES
jgi:hypothetical protein